MQNQAMHGILSSHFGRRLSTILLMLGFAGSSHAAWLSVCDQQPAGALAQPAEGYRTHVWSVQGQLTLLQVTEQAPRLANCQVREIKGPSSEVRWASLVAPLDASVYHLTLQGQERDGNFAVTEVILPEVDPPKTARAPSPEAKNTPTRPPAPAASPPPALVSKFQPGRSAWFWSPVRWREAPQEIFSSQQEHGLRRIYITVPIEQDVVQHPQALADFIREARARQLEVWAVIGDPAAVLKDGTESFARMAASYAAFNQHSAMKLDGLQLDVEPYLLPGYQLSPLRWQDVYIEMVRHIRRAAPELSLDVAVPFWWGVEKNGGPAFLAGLGAVVDSLTIMDYRTQVEEIVRFAEPFLRWGQKFDKAVQVALEALHIPDETRRHFYSAPVAELWHVSLAGRDVLLLLDQPASLEQARGFKFQRTSYFLGSTVSFHGRKQELMDLLPVLEKRLQSWPSFSGMALHGIE